ncbi:S1 family peptidase [Salinarimonas soli]|uniref:Trypsin-like serine protease n=1 Tax=Salinarimonas soli TaxID=1638099 RepID=A0A5B2VZG6_9HYPH|nr:trypsin-like serine protease [Salinarimonas soli]KAA2244194.1 trypsin-like serine protease [Salinarimonas soli]
MRLTLAAIALAVLTLPAGAVVRGEPSRDPDGLRTIVVRVENSDGELCSGALIAPDIVLTAAHCVLQRSRYRVVTLDRSFRARSSGASQVAIHPAFVPGTTPRGQPGVDLALMRLDRALGADFTPLDPRAAVSVGMGEPLVLAGYGITAEGRSGTARTLRQTNLVALGPLQVANRVLVGVDPERFAARTGAGACRGDSGGPILRREGGSYRLLGVVSWSSGAFEERRPTACGGYTAITPVTDHMRWIVDQAALMSAYGSGGAVSRVPPVQDWTAR